MRGGVFKMISITVLVILWKSRPYSRPRVNNNYHRRTFVYISLFVRHDSYSHGVTLTDFILGHQHVEVEGKV